MTNKRYRGASRGRRVTAAEAEKYRQVRRQVEQEIRPATANPVKVAIAKLRAMRQAKGVTLSQLAARTGMTRGNLARLELQKNATVATLQRYARGLDCNLQINLVEVELSDRSRHTHAG